MWPLFRVSVCNLADVGVGIFLKNLEIGDDLQQAAGHRVQPLHVSLGSGDSAD